MPIYTAVNATAAREAFEEMVAIRTVADLGVPARR
jgi:hypothetical protein